MASAITRARQYVYDTLLALGSDKYHDRYALAAAMHKTWLNPTDVAALDLLEDEGLIEKTRQQVNGNSRGSNATRWAYKVVSK